MLRLSKTDVVITSTAPEKWYDFRHIKNETVVGTYEFAEGNKCVHNFQNFTVIARKKKIQRSHLTDPSRSQKSSPKSCRMVAMKSSSLTALSLYKEDILTSPTFFPWIFFIKTLSSVSQFYDHVCLHASFAICQDFFFVHTVHCTMFAKNFGFGNLFYFSPPPPRRRILFLFLSLFVGYIRRCLDLVRTGKKRQSRPARKTNRRRQTHLRIREKKINLDLR